MYGLPQAGLLAQRHLITHLNHHYYIQTDTTCLFRYKSNGTTFSLVVDDFGVKYTNKAGVDHLITTLRALYTITIDWTGSKYLRFSIFFDYTQRTVTLSMPGYISKALQRFAPSLSVGAKSPAIYIPPTYGATQQSPSEDTSTPLSPQETTTLQEIVGSLLYYARGVDVTRHSPFIAPIASHAQRAPSITTPPGVLLSISQQCLALPRLRHGLTYSIRRILSLAPHCTICRGSHFLSLKWWRTNSHQRFCACFQFYYTVRCRIRYRGGICSPLPSWSRWCMATHHTSFSGVSSAPHNYSLQ